MAYITAIAHSTDTNWTASLRQGLKAAIQTVRDLDQRWKARAELAALSERQLRDIALTRSDVAALAHRALPTKVGQELMQIRSARSCNW